MATPYERNLLVRRRVLTDFGYRDLLHRGAAAPDPAWPPPDESIFEHPAGVKTALRQWLERKLTPEGRLIAAHVAALMVLPSLVQVLADDELVRQLEHPRRSYAPEAPPWDETGLSARVMREAVMSMAAGTWTHRPLPDQSSRFGQRTLAEIHDGLRGLAPPDNALLWSAAWAAKALQWAPGSRSWHQQHGANNANDTANAIIAALVASLMPDHVYLQYSGIRILDEPPDRRIVGELEGEPHDLLAPEVRASILRFLSEWWARTRGRLPLDRPWFSPQSLINMLDQLKPEQQGLAAAVAARMVRGWPTPKVHRQQVAAPTEADNEQIELRIDELLAGRAVQSGEGWCSMLTNLDEPDRVAWSLRTAHPRYLTQLLGLCAAEHAASRNLTHGARFAALVAVLIAAYYATGIPVATLPELSVRRGESTREQANEYNEAEIDIYSPFQPDKVAFLDQWWARVREYMPELAHLGRLA